MKAMVVTFADEGGKLSLQDVLDPIPGEGQVAIRMEGTAVSFADIEMREGRYHTPRKPPIIPGHDVVGTVIGLGPGVSGFRVGDRVTAISFSGSYAEIVLAPAAVTWLLPDEVDRLSGASFPTNGVTSYNLLTLAGRMAPGETVLIHSAAGGVGTTTSQLAKLLGAGTVIGTVGNDVKAELVRSLGCDYVINYRTDDFADRVMAITKDAGADLILDSVAGSVTEKSLACLAPWGRIVVYGMSGGVAGQIPTNFLHAGNRSAIGYSTGGYRYAKPHVLRPAGDAVLGYLRSKQLKMVISAEYPLHEANAALDLVESRKSTGRVVLTNE
jgi:NADPH:quinone reductase